MNSNPSTWSASSRNQVCVCGIGARTPLGLDARASAAAVRGAISAVAAHSYLVDKTGAPMALACDPVLEARTPLAQRIESLLLDAVSQACEVLEGAGGSLSLGCWIALAESRPGWPDDVAPIAERAAAACFGGRKVGIRSLSRGHAAGLLAFQTAAQQVSTGAVDVALAVGVDSYCTQDTLDWLDRSGWLMSPSNRNGFPPSEAAGACLLTSRATAQAHQWPILATVLVASSTIEEHTIRGESVCIGTGLTAVLREVIAALPASAGLIASTYCDLNGERYRNEEYLYSMLRTQEAFVDAHDYTCPADCWGDVGAAGGPLYACLAIEAMQRGYAKGPLALLWGSSEGGLRAATILSLNSRGAPGPAR